MGVDLQTPYGLRFEVTDTINDGWNDYDKQVATIQLSNYGRIYIDTTYKRPIDNEYELEDINDTFEAFQKGE